MVTPHRPWLLSKLLAVVALCVVAALSWWAARDPGPQPVRPTSLTATGWRARLTGRAWEDLPFDLPADEAADVATCEVLARRLFTSVEDVVQFDRADTREALEAILVRRPKLFYAEALLGTWHQRAGDDATAQAHAERAEVLAPAVLVQRFQYDDGQPLAGAVIRSFELECNRVKNGSLDPSLKLLYVGLVTDASGDIRLPAYRTVWRTNSMAHPPGFDVTFPPLGWFVSRGKVGLLPPAVVRPKG